MYDLSYIKLEEEKNIGTYEAATKRAEEIFDANPNITQITIVGQGKTYIINKS